MPSTRTRLFPHWWYLVREPKSSEVGSNCLHFSTRLMWKHFSRVLSYALCLPDNKFSSVFCVCLLLFIVIIFKGIYSYCDLL